MDYTKIIDQMSEKSAKDFIKYCSKYKIVISELFKYAVMNDEWEEE